jgi:hypothetical protein
MSSKPNPSRETVPLMPRYGVEKLGVTRYEAKIKCENAASLRLFQERLGFQEVSRSHVFQAGAPDSAPIPVAFLAISSSANPGRILPLGYTQRALNKFRGAGFLAVV